MRIAPSILSADFAALGEAIARVEAAGADQLHVDVMDGHFVPNLTIGPPVIESIRKRTRLPLDVHLMIEEPERWVETYVKAGADYLTIHVEACPHLERALSLIREAGAKSGVALNPATAPEVLEYVLDDLDLVLVMSVNPGFGGQSFIPTAYEKIRRLRALLAGREVLISVDGGVKAEHAGPLREVRVALLEADVNFKVVKAFVERVRIKAVGQDVLQSLTPGQQVVKVVRDELVELLGGSAHRLAMASHPPTVVMLIGLQGSGKTTSAAKLARHFQKQGQHPLLVAADVYRPAAIDQLKTLGAQLGVPVVGEADQRPVDICSAARDEAARRGLSPLILDTAGRLHIDEEMLEELRAIKKAVGPHHVLLVVDAMTGQDAVTVADKFNAAIGIDAVILTKMDGDARGGAALSVREVTGRPIAFVGVGEKSDALEPFHPDRLAQRILGIDR